MRFIVGLCGGGLQEANHTRGKNMVVLLGSENLSIKDSTAAQMKAPQKSSPNPNTEPVDKRQISTMKGGQS